MNNKIKFEDLQKRYNVGRIVEDEWHAYAGKRTESILRKYLNCTLVSQLSPWLLNAGAGIYSLNCEGWKELAIDLFSSPLKGRSDSICADIHHLPLRASTLGAIVCVGEVLGYCDPGRVIDEFSRALQPKGILIVDFSSTKGSRHWFHPSFGRAADIINDEYNGSVEKIWAYDPTHILFLLKSAGFDVQGVIGTHGISGVLRRYGVSVGTALKWDQWVQGWKGGGRFADVVTIVAKRSSPSQEPP